MVKVGAAYKVKRPIPEHAWAEFPELKGKARIKVVSLGADEKSAKRRFLSEIDAIEARIERAALKAPKTAKPIQSSEPRLYEPKEILAAIDRWRDKRTVAHQKFGHERELKELNGIEVPLEDFDGRDLTLHRLDAIGVMCRRIIKEEAGRTKGKYFVGFDAARFSAHGEFDAYNALPDFQERMALALNEEGINLRSNAPILIKSFAIEAFAEAWSRVLKSELHWLCGSLLYEPSESILMTEGEQPAKPAAPNVKQQRKVHTLSQLLDSYLESEERNDASRKRTHWRLLINNVGDINPRECLAEHFVQLKINMRKAPLVRSDTYKALSLEELIQRKEEIAEKTGNTEPRDPKTIFDYFCSFQTVFEYACLLKLVDDNPLKGLMPPKPKFSKKIKAYNDEDIALIFSKPMFNGCDKVRTEKGQLWGYRKTSGQKIERDGRYFMPILALFTGARMEELGGARIADFKEHNGVWYLDLTKRKLKTESSKRIVPLHPRLLNTRDIDFLGYLGERRRLGDEYLFPEFRPSVSEENGLKSEILALMDDELDEDDQIQDQDGDVIKMTAYYSKWFAAWSLANKVKQKGKNFHSFRHTMKARLRMPNTNEHLNDLITGHARPSTGAAYGGDDETVLSMLPELFEAICRVEYPTFPELTKPIT